VESPFRCHAAATDAKQRPGFPTARDTNALPNHLRAAYRELTSHRSPMTDFSGAAVGRPLGVIWGRTVGVGLGVDVGLPEADAVGLTLAVAVGVGVGVVPGMRNA
jgi:hypothetical protein